MAFEYGTLTFCHASARRSKAIICAVTAVLCVLMVVQMRQRANSLVDVYMLVVGIVAVVAAIGFVRSFRIGIEVSDEGVVARTTYTVRSYRWDEIASAESVDRAIFVTGRNVVPMNQQTRGRVQVIPVLHLTNGARVRLQGLQVHVDSAFVPNWIDDAVEEINERIEERHGALGSGAPLG